MLCKFLYKKDVHAKKNHAMENHVRRGIAVLPRFLTYFTFPL